MMSILKEILLQFFVALLCVGSLAGLVLGLALLFRHEKVGHMNQNLSRWISVGGIAEYLDQPRPTERFFYRHHRLVGSFMLGGALFILYTFLFQYNQRRISGVFVSDHWIALDVLMAIMIVGSVLAAVVGLVILARPSLLREIEKACNRWISTDGMARVLDRIVHSSDQQILRRRKLVGSVLIACSLYVLIVLGQMLWRGELALTGLLG